MLSSIAGLACLLVFALSQAVRDTFFGATFQPVGFLVVAILAFGASALVFAGWVALRRPVDIRALLSDRSSLAALNVTTAASWIACILAFAVFATVSGMLRGWAEVRRC